MPEVIKQKALQLEPVLGSYGACKFSHIFPVEKPFDEVTEPTYVCRAVPIPGICIGIDGIGIGQVGYTSTNSVVCALLTMN